MSLAKITQKPVNVSLFSVRKNADDLKNALESVVIPMFCNATISKWIYIFLKEGTCNY